MEIIDRIIPHCLSHQIRIITTTLVSKSLCSLRQATATNSMAIFIHCHYRRSTPIFRVITQPLIHSHCCLTPSPHCFDTRCSLSLTRELLHFHQMIWLAQRPKLEVGCSS